MEVAIFRFVQEAFSNVLKHAKATNIDMKMIFQPKEMIIEIKDNGVGFVSDRIDEKIKSGSHFGLVGMRERVEMLEGRFELDTKPNQGTKISMRVPVEPESNGKEGS